MASILDTAPYPWSDPLAWELHRTLYSAVPRPSRALLMASSAGLNTGLVNSDQAPFDVWKELLELSATSGKTRALIQKVRADPSLAVAHPLLDALLNDQAPATDKQPFGPGGAPVFLSKDDTVTEPEALLFHDDLTLSTGRMPWLVDVLQRLIHLSPAICRLEVAHNNDSQSGTGVRIGPDLLLTNWHVLFVAGKLPTAVTAQFGYEFDSDGKGLSATSIACDPSSVRADQGDDWGIVRVQASLPTSVPTIDISSGAVPMRDAPAFIIQHPGGGRKRVAYVRNQITYFDNRVVHYVSDTQVGSSGSPVFDELGRMIALHHSGGRPQEIAGQLPIKKNEGIRASRVAAGLKSGGFI